MTWDSRWLGSGVEPWEAGVQRRGGKRTHVWASGSESQARARPARSSGRGQGSESRVGEGQSGTHVSPETPADLLGQRKGRIFDGSCLINK